MRREWRLPALGGVAVLLLLALGYRLLGGAEEPPAPVTEAPATPAPAPQMAESPPPAPPPVSPEGLRLHGVTGAGAIIAGADGRQRLIAIGREVLPGLTLARVSVDHALLRSAAGDIRLDFTGTSAAPTASATAPAPSGTPQEAAIRDDALRYRLAFAPHRVGARIGGHVLRPGQSLPVLEQAGLRPGDVVLRVNDSEFDQERMLELARTVATSDRVVFEIERDGRPMRVEAPGGLAR